MADFINIRKGRNALSSALYVLLNIMLAVGSTFLTLASGSWILGALLVILSKWRVVAVRPRYWWVNIKGSMVDLIVGMSLVYLVYFAGSELNFAHIILTLIYAVWLVVIKPKSSEAMTEIQALMAVFLGMSVAAIMSTSLDPVVLVIMGFIVGYGAARHILIQYEDYDFSLVTFLIGLMVGEVSFIMYHWLIIYSFDSVGLSLVVPQLAMAATLLMFVFVKGYKSVLKHDGLIRVNEVLTPAIFSGLIMLLMVIYFSKPIFNV